MGRRSGMSRKQTMGIILIIAAAIHYIPIVSKLSWLGVLATFVIGLFLLLK